MASLKQKFLAAGVGFSLVSSIGAQTALGMHIETEKGGKKDDKFIEHFINVVFPKDEVFTFYKNDQGLRYFKNFGEDDDGIRLGTGGGEYKTAAECYLPIVDDGKKITVRNYVNKCKGILSTQNKKINTLIKSGKLNEEDIECLDGMGKIKFPSLPGLGMTVSLSVYNVGEKRFVSIFMIDDTRNNKSKIGGFVTENELFGYLDKSVDLLNYVKDIIEKRLHLDLLKVGDDPGKYKEERDKIRNKIIMNINKKGGYKFKLEDDTECVLKCSIKKDQLGNKNNCDFFELEEDDDDFAKIDDKKLENAIKTILHSEVKKLNNGDNIFKAWQEDVAKYEGNVAKYEGNQKNKWVVEGFFTLAFVASLVYYRDAALSKYGRKILVSTSTTTINGDGQTINTGTIGGLDLLQGDGDFLTDHPLEIATVASATTMGIGMAGRYALKNSKNGTDFNQSANGEEASENTGIYVDSYASSAETTAETVSDNVETKENENGTENEVNEVVNDAQL